MGSEESRLEPRAVAIGPRALLVDLSERFGGGGSRTLGLLRGFAPGEAALACLGDGPLVRLARESGIEVHVVKRKKWDPRVMLRLTEIVRTGRFDLLDAQNSQSKIWCTWAARRTGAGLVSTLNSWYESEHGGRPKGRILQAIERTTTAQTDTFVVVAREIERKLLESGVDPERIHLIPNAVEIPELDARLDGTWLKGELGIPLEARICCNVGRLVEAKSQDLLIEAIARCENPLLYCLIVGEGHLRHALEARIRAHGLGERVRLLGYRDPRYTLAVIGASDFFVLSSTTEGTPIVLLEAAALGRPIVATRVGGVADMFADGQEALLAEPGDSAALARAISTLLERPKLASRLGQAGRSRVEAGNSVARQVSLTRAAYKQAFALSRQGHEA